MEAVIAITGSVVIKVKGMMMEVTEVDRQLYCRLKHKWWWLLIWFNQLK